MEIRSSAFSDEDALPRIPPIIYEELKTNFNIDYILGMSDLKQMMRKLAILEVSETY